MRPLLRQLREKTAASSERIPPEIIKANADMVWTLIRAHTTVEEPLLKVLVAQKNPAQKASQHALDEHQEIELLLKMAIQSGDRRVLHRATDLILGHIFEEERDVFPLAEKVLTPSKQAALGLEWLKSRGIK